MICKNRLTLLCGIAIACASVASCEIINPEEDIPSYIQIDQFQVVSNSLEEGSLSNNITDAWVYIDDELIGTFELPALVPILAEGDRNLMVSAGIKRNGIGATRVEYPFYQSFKNDTNFVLYRDSVLVVKPVIRYFPSTEIQFASLEDFEDPVSLNIDSLVNSTARIRATSINDLVFEGNSSGLIELHDTNSFFHGATNRSYVLPRGGANVYLEMDYNTTVNLEIGSLVNTFDRGVVERPIITLTPTGDLTTNVWNKVYIDLTSTISSETAATDHKIYWKASSNGGDGRVLLDNLKLVYQ